MINFFLKSKSILMIFLISFIFSKQSYPNEFDNISACAGVVMGDGAAELRDTFKMNQILTMLLNLQLRHFMVKAYQILVLRKTLQ